MFHTVRANKYKLHLMETATGLRFALVTEPSVGNLQQAMQHMLTVFYVEDIVKNALESPCEALIRERFAESLLSHAKSFEDPVDK